MTQIIVNETYENLQDWSFITRAVSETLRHAGKTKEAELSIVIDGDEKLHELNLQFLEVDASTDVLSFPAEEIDPETGEEYLGDVIISYPRAQSQAESAGHPLNSELELLVVHGVLHLLGYDHSSEVEKADMWTIQQQILTTLGTQLSRFPD